MPLRNYELVDCLNGLQKSSLQEVNNLALEYDQLKKQFRVGDWILPENSVSVQIQITNRGIGERYAKALRDKLSPLGADATNIQLKEKPPGGWVLELDKELLWQQVGRLMMKKELDKYNLAVNTLLNSVLKRENPSASAINNFNARIEGMLQQAVKGYPNENFSPYPEWFMEHKNEVETWLQKSYLLPSVKRQLEEILNRTRELNKIYEVLRNILKVNDKAVIIQFGSVTEPGQSVRVYGTDNPVHFSAIQQTLSQFGLPYSTNLPYIVIKPTSEYQVLNDPNFNDNFLRRYHTNLGSIATMEKIKDLLRDISFCLQNAHDTRTPSEERLLAQRRANNALEYLILLTQKGDPKRGFVGLPQWLNENKEKVDECLKSDYVSHSLKQELQKCVSPEKYYDRSYKGNDPLVQLVIQKLLINENLVFQQLHSAGGFNASLEVDKLLKELEKLDKDLLAPYQRARKVSVLLNQTHDNQAPDSLFGKMVSHLLKDRDYNHLLASQRVLPETQLRAGAAATQPAPAVAKHAVSPPAKAAVAGTTRPALAAKSIPVSLVTPAAALPNSAFNAAVWVQIAKIVDNDKKMLAIQRLQDLSASLNTETMDRLNSDPKLAAKFLAQNADFMNIFLGASASVQRVKLNNLPDSIKFESEVRPARR